MSFGAPHPRGPRPSLGSALPDWQSGCFPLFPPHRLGLLAHRLVDEAEDRAVLEVAAGVKILGASLAQEPALGSSENWLNLTATPACRLG